METTQTQTVKQEKALNMIKITNMKYWQHRREKETELQHNILWNKDGETQNVKSESKQTETDFMIVFQQFFSSIVSPDTLK